MPNPTTRKLEEGLNVEASDLPGLLAAALAHPDLPYRVWEGIIDGLLEIDEGFGKFTEPYLRGPPLLFGIKKGPERSRQSSPKPYLLRSFSPLISSP
jgi:hypothetical protein